MCSAGTAAPAPAAVRLAGGPSLRRSLVPFPAFFTLPRSYDWFLQAVSPLSHSHPPHPLHTLIPLPPLPRSYDWFLWAMQVVFLMITGLCWYLRTLHRYLVSSVLCCALVFCMEWRGRAEQGWASAGTCAPCTATW